MRLLCPDGVVMSGTGKIVCLKECKIWDTTQLCPNRMFCLCYLSQIFYFEPMIQVIIGELKSMLIAK